MPDGFTSGELEILRGDLARIFHEATRERTEYLFNDSIASMEEIDAGGEDPLSMSVATRTGKS